METAEAVREIVGAMTPLIGENMARAAATFHCGKLGIAADAITDAQVEALVARLETGLHVFVGRGKAAAAMSDLRTRLRGQS